MDSKQFSLMLLAACLLSPFLTSAAASLLENTCNDVSKRSASPSAYSDCMQALQSDPRSSKASDYRALAQVAIEISLANTTDSLNFIHGMLKTNSTAPIKQCAIGYEGAVGSFKSALAELKQDDSTCTYDVKVAGDDVVNCEDGLKAAGVRIPSISSRNDMGILYSKICDVITNKIDFKSPA